MSEARLPSRFVTPSGREWSASVCRFHGDRCVLMSPLGSDTYSGGGVRAMHVDRTRIDDGDRTWKPTGVPDWGSG